MADPKKIPKRGPLSRTCARCHAAPGHTCRSPNGRTVQTHSIRRNPTAPPPPHRPTLLSDQLRDDLCNALRLGSPLNMATASVGLSITTVYRWLAQADTDDPDAPSPHRDFRDAITQARAQGGVQQLARINQAAARHLRSEEPMVWTDDKGKVHAVLDGEGKPLIRRVWEQDWRAAGFILERGFARDFGRREVVELTTGDSVDPTPVTPGLAGADGEGVSAVLTSIQAFKARKELEAGSGDDGVVDAEIVDEG